MKHNVLSNREPSSWYRNEFLTPLKVLINHNYVNDRQMKFTKQKTSWPSPSSTGPNSKTESDRHSNETSRGIISVVLFIIPHKVVLTVSLWMKR